MLFLLNSAGVPSVASFLQIAAATQTPDFNVGASPSSQSVVQGAAANYNVIITASGGFSGSVGFSVSGLPTGTSATFTLTSVAGSGTSVMKVSTLASTVGGTYALTITATSGALVHTASATLVVTAPTNFSIAVSPASQTIRSNSSTKYTITITGLNGFGGSVQLSVTGLPSRTNSSFSTNPVVGSGTSTLSVRALPKSKAGTYPLTITGTSGGLVHSTSISLVIQ